MPAAKILPAGQIVGDPVTNNAGEALGWIDDIVIDVQRGRIAYAVLAFNTQLLGREGKRFAVPWSLLRLGDDGETFLLDVECEVLARAPGFDEGELPDYADRAWAEAIHGHYGAVVR
jgi:sporulation protein YlmC with PRC-barrel domain